MKIKTMNITDICKKHLDGFKTYPYQLRGMLNSEIFLIYAIAKEWNVEYIIESGTARGHSTLTLARNLPDVDIITIDSKKDDDTDYARGKITTPNVAFIQGNSIHLLDKYISKNCLILIDGPKGIHAINLAKKHLPHPFVQGVFVHDIHSACSERMVFENTFDKTFYTDDSDYVKSFRHLDKECWKKLAKHGDALKKPYHRRGVKIDSYASTLAFAYQ